MVSFSSRMFVSLRFNSSGSRPSSVNTGIIVVEVVVKVVEVVLVMVVVEVMVVVVIVVVVGMFVMAVVVARCSSSRSSLLL